MEPTPRAGAGIYGGRKTLSIMLTYACPAECKNCGTISSPRDRNNIGLKEVIAGIDEAKTLGFENIVFTGGEATLRWDDLLAALRHADVAAFPTRLVTNAHWAQSPEIAARRLDQLLEAGLDEINFSTGDEHTRFIPLEQVLFAALATIARGQTAYIMVELRAERTVTKNAILQHPLLAHLSKEEKALIRPSESPWMPLDPAEVQAYPNHIAVNAGNLDKCGGCDSVLQTYVMQADGRIGACCGLGMRIIPELSVALSGEKQFLSAAIQAAEEDFLKVWMRFKGPEKILAWAARHDPEIKWENMYGHRCQACLRVYKDPKVQEVIRKHHHEVIPDVLQTAWLQECYMPQKLAISKKAGGAAETTG